MKKDGLSTPDDMPLFGARDTLSLAREKVFNELEPGVECPCCSQFCKAYTRRINSGMARALIWIVRTWSATQPRDWIHLPTKAPRHVLANRELPRFTFWGMVVARMDESQSKRDSGFWRPTELGVSFALGDTRVPSWVKLYDNKVREWSKELVGIHEALGTRFDYDQLMHGKAGE